MKKSELKALLKVITEEVMTVKRAQLNESKGLSGFKKSKDSTEHTEKVADSKSLTPTSEPKEKEEGKKLPVVKKPANPQKVGDLKEGFGDMLQSYADWSLFIKDAVAVGSIALVLLLAGYLWLSDKIKSGISKFVLKRFGAELDAYLKKRANEIRNDPAIQKALADPKHTGLYLAIKAKLNQQDLEMNQKVRKAFGKDIVPSLARAVDAQPTTNLKEEIIEMIHESIEEMARVKGAVGSKFKVEDPSSPTGWVVKGHKTIPDGTPTESPKGPYVKKGENPNLGRPKKVTVSPSATGSANDATKNAIENILTAAPETTDGDIIDQLTTGAGEDEKLNLDHAFIKKTADEVRKQISAEKSTGAEDAPEAELANLASAEERKKAQQRAFWIKKLQARKKLK